MSLFLAHERSRKSIAFQLVLDENYILLLNKVDNNLVEGALDKEEQFQIQASSRYSFLGCWLHLEPFPKLHSPDYLSDTINEQKQKKSLFIFRDSLSAKDFSRLSQAIKKCNTAF